MVLEVGGGADSTGWGDFPMLLAQETGGTVVTYDRAWRKAHQQMAASIPDAVLFEAEGCDHFIPEKQPEIIIQAVKQVILLAK